MASAIERFLYGDAADMVSSDGRVGDYFVSEIVLSENTVTLRIASERRPYEFRRVMFRDARLGPFSQNAAEPDDLVLPWEIVGFHSWECEGGDWQIKLVGYRLRWSWTSRWPEIEDA